MSASLSVTTPHEWNVEGHTSYKAFMLYALSSILRTADILRQILPTPSFPTNRKTTGKLFSNRELDEYSGWHQPKMSSLVALVLTSSRLEEIERREATGGLDHTESFAVCGGDHYTTRNDSSTCVPPDLAILPSPRQGATVL